MTTTLTTQSIEPEKPCQCGCDSALTAHDENGKDISSTGWILAIPDALTVDLLNEVEIERGDLHSYGREKEPHITVFGFIGATLDVMDINHEAVSRLLEALPPFEVELTGLGLFEREKYDVLMFLVNSPELNDLHQKLRTAVSHDWPYDVYTPHVTVAYLKPGTGRKYLDRTELDGRLFKVSQIIYRAPDYTQGGDDDHIFSQKDTVYVLSETVATPQEPTTNETDFPTAGDDQKITLRNSQYPQFDYAYAVALKEEYPDIWQRGGNVRGNDAFTLWGRARDGAETTAVLSWIKEREAWAARHLDNFQLAGVVAQIKWGVIGSRGEGYMKELVNEAKSRLDGNRTPTPNHTLIDMRLAVNAGKGRKERKHGREYLVVPYVGVVEGVMNGKLVLMEEVKAAGLLWDDSPVVVNHPEQNGAYISSKSPDVPKLGRVYRSQVKDTRLMGELWVDVETARATREGQAALNRLGQGETMEVSWGWWQVAEQIAGEYKGKAYDAISRNLIPDHLAILLNAPGACSVADGCGTYRVNKAEAGNAQSALLLTNGCTCAMHDGQTHTEVLMSDELAREGEDVEEVLTDEVTPETDEPTPEAAVADPVTESEVEEAVVANQTDEVAVLRRELREIKQALGQLQANAQQKTRQEREGRIARLAANDACPFNASELRDFNDAQLQTFEAKYRTADLSARGGYGMASNRQEAVVPLVVPQVLLAPASGREVKAHG